MKNEKYFIKQEEISNKMEEYFKKSEKYFHVAQGKNINNVVESKQLQGFAKINIKINVQKNAFRYKLDINKILKTC